MWFGMRKMSFYPLVQLWDGEYALTIGNSTRSLSAPFPGSDARPTCGTLSLLLPSWLFGIQPDYDEPRRPREDNHHMSIWNICLQKNVVWALQCSIHLSKMHDRHFLKSNRKHHGSLHG